MITNSLKPIISKLHAAVTVCFILFLCNTEYTAQADSLNSFLNFFPLQINNSWEYNYVICDPFENCEANSFIEIITGDTLFNNNYYFISNYRTIGYEEKYYYRIDTINGNVLKVYDNDTLTEYRIDSLYANEGDFIFITDRLSDIYTIEITSFRDTVIDGIQRLLRKTVDDRGNNSTYISGIGRIKSSGYLGNTLLNNAIINGLPYDFTTDVQGKEISVSDFNLSQNYPNPFNPTTTIEYTIPNGAHSSEFVSLKIYDILGREVATLVNKTQSAAADGGKYKVQFDSSIGSHQLPSGIYFYTLQAGKYKVSRKMLLLK